jgi:hypothetical protein
LPVLDAAAEHGVACWHPRLAAQSEGAAHA